MLLKKTRSMRRTTSMTEFAADVVFTDVEVLQTPHEQENVEEVTNNHLSLPPQGRALGAVDWLESRYQGSLVPPPSPLGSRHRRISADFAMDTAPFLRACGLCKRRLGPGRDTYMYRGDIAFCSLECRQQHINQDERMENCSLTSIKDISTASNGSEQTSDAEMIAAA
ncbi:hypothetical protein Cni_G15155 [Canna indica]|uniref:FLZ-type domain-containing protein n=1 Tax=Canna indica TaxID=4628 RepID=A0AAQ3QEH8_9LILI|nr:hypothetical protein Cni_G15155 [Canna indica]